MIKFEVGKSVFLSDIQTLAVYTNDTGKAIDNICNKIVDIERFKDYKETVVELVKLEDYGLYIISRVFDGYQDIYLGFCPEGFEFGDRYDVIDSGFHFIFEYNESVYDAIYAKNIESNNGEFNLQSTQTVYQDKEMCVFSEWLCENQIDNPYLLVFEMGSKADSSLIKMFECVLLKENELEVV